MKKRVRKLLDADLMADGEQMNDVQAPQTALSGDLGSIILENMLTLWVDPELERRGGAPEWTREKLTRIQVIMYVGRTPQVLLNDEAEVIMSIKLKPGIPKNRGEPIMLDEIERVHDLEPARHKDAGHMTAVRIGEGWSLAFDFRYNLTWAKAHADAAREFFETAREALRHDRRRAAVDTAASSAELAAKAILLTMPDQVLLDSKSHAVVHEKFNVYAKLNVPPEQRLAFNRLRQVRPGARYLDRDSPPASEIESMLGVLGNLVEDAERRTAPRSAVPGGSPAQSSRPPQANSGQAREG